MIPTWRGNGAALMTALVVAASLAAACGSSQETPSSQAPADSGAAAKTAASHDAAANGERAKVVLLGDSLTAGLGLLESQAYPAVLQQLVDKDGYDYEIDNAGVSGETSAGGLRRLDWALQGNVKVLVLALGANDGLRGLSVEEMKSNLTQIIERARARDVMVIVAGMEAPPNYGQEYATSFRQAFRDVAQQQRVLFVPFLLDRVAGHPDLNQADGIHPNAQGAQIVAATVWNVLRSALDRLATS